MSETSPRPIRRSWTPRQKGHFEMLILPPTTHSKAGEGCPTGLGLHARRCSVGSEGGRPKRATSIDYLNHNYSGQY